MTKLPPLQTSETETETETEILLRPIQAYTAVLFGANVTILMLYFPVVAPLCTSSRTFRRIRVCLPFLERASVKIEYLLLL